MSRDEQAAAQTPELVKVAARAMPNDLNSISGELVRAWKALVAENRQLRRDNIELGKALAKEAE